MDNTYSNLTNLSRIAIFLVKSNIDYYSISANIRLDCWGSLTGNPISKFITKSPRLEGSFGNGNPCLGIRLIVDGETISLV